MKLLAHSSKYMHRHPRIGSIVQILWRIFSMRRYTISFFSIPAAGVQVHTAENLRAMDANPIATDISDLISTSNNH